MPHTDEHGLIWETDEEALGTNMAAAIHSDQPPPGFWADIWGHNELDDGLMRGATAMLKRHAKAKNE